MARGNLTLRPTAHAKARMLERGLLIGDVLFALKNGFVFDEAEPTTEEGCFKYRVESTTPNSGERTVVVVVIPSTANAMKIVTVMWKDGA